MNCTSTNFCCLNLYEKCVVGDAITVIIYCCCRLITEDAESGLFAVTIFRKVLDEYKLHCRENK